MPYNELGLGAAGYVLIYRVRFHQRRQGLSLAELSKTMGDLGHPLSPQRIGQVLNARRRLATDDLTALATALGVSASALVLDKSPLVDKKLVQAIRSLEDGEVEARLAQAGIERDGLEARIPPFMRFHEGTPGVDDAETILDRIETLCLEIEALEVEVVRRQTEQRRVEFLTDADVQDQALDDRILRGDFGDKPGDKTYEVHNRRSQARRATREASDGER